MRVLSYVLAALTLAAAVVALVITPDRRRTASQLGVARRRQWGWSSCSRTRSPGRSSSDRFHDPDERAAAGAVWAAFLGDLRTFGWVLVGSGGLAAAAAASLVRPVAIEGTLLRGLAGRDHRARLDAVARGARRWPWSRSARS